MPLNNALKEAIQGIQKKAYVVRQPLQHSSQQTNERSPEQLSQALKTYMEHYVVVMNRLHKGLIDVRKTIQLDQLNALAKQTPRPLTYLTLRFVGSLVSGIGWGVGLYVVLWVCHLWFHPFKPIIHIIGKAFQ